MTIQAAQTAQSTCPAWCSAHIPSCISVDQVVEATSGPERARVYVSLEQAAGEPVAVRIQGAGDTPMQLDQALTLAMQLIALVVAASAGEVR